MLKSAYVRAIGMLSPAKFRQSSRNNRKVTFVLRYTILMLDMYPVFIRQIKFNHRMRFERKIDDNAKQDADASKTKERTETSSFMSDVNHDHRLPLVKELANVEKWHRFHFIFCMSIYIMELFRYLLIHLISCEFLSEYHYLDCYMLGRFRFIGRTNKISSTMMFTFVSGFIMYRYILFLIKPKFQFQVLEFILYKYEQVVENELEFESSQQARKIYHTSSESLNRTTKPTNKLESYSKLGRARPNCAFYLRNHFYGNSIESKWILRPNRTSKSWAFVMTFLNYGFYLSIVLNSFYFIIMSYTLAGSIITNLGYEMSYATCVAYIQNKQWGPGAAGNGTTLRRHSEFEFGHIYLTPRVLAHQMRIEDIPAIIPVTRIDLQSMTTYNLLRIACDLVENIFWYTEFAIIFNGVYTMVLMCSVDIMVNAYALMKRLKRLTRRLVELRPKPGRSDVLNSKQQVGQQNLSLRPADIGYHKGSHYRQYLYGNSPIVANRYQLGPSYLHHHIVANRRATMDILGSKASSCEDKLDKEATILQAILVDHFLLVREYSKIVSFYFNFILCIFFLMTIVMSYWISTIKSRAVEFEFLATEVASTCAAVTFFSSAALARSFNFKLYKLIAQAMALDTSPDSRRRWATIMNYYKPKPLYCFRLFDSTEISWLFSLKFVSWMASAFVVLANFYYMNRS